MFKNKSSLIAPAESCKHRPSGIPSYLKVPLPVRLIMFPLTQLESGLYYVYRHYADIFYGFHQIVRLPEKFPTPELFQEYVQKRNFRFWSAFVLSVGIALETIFRVIRSGGVTDHYLFTVSRIWNASIEQRNFISLGVYIIYPIFFIFLTFETFPHMSTIVYFHPDEAKSLTITYQGKLLPKTLAKALLDYFHRIKRRIDGLNFYILLDIHLVWTVPFFVGELFFPDPVTTWSVRSIFYMIITPVYITELIYSVLLPNYFYSNCKYIIIKQNYYRKWLQMAIDNVHARQGNETISFTRMIRVFDYQFRQIFGHMKDVRVINSFWSKWNTVTLGHYSLEVIYIYFTMVTAKTATERIQLIPTLFFGNAYSIYIYVISHNSSRIFQNNVDLHKLIRMFHSRVSRLKLVSRKNIIEHHKQTTFEHYFRFTGFRLLNGARINNRMFEFCFSSLAIFCVKLFGRKLAEYF